MTQRGILTVCLTAGMLAGLWLAGCSDDDDNGNGPALPAGLAQPNGDYYKGTMGDSVLTPELTYAVRDASGNNIPGQHIQIEPLEGDGTPVARSVTTGSDGLAHSWHKFSGKLGHAVIRAVGLGGADTTLAFVRASTLIPGDHGQGQYVLFDDTYADVKHFNGTPASVDTYPDHEIIYVNYEAAAGVVVMVYDLDYNRVIYDTSAVFGVIVNTKFTDTTAEGIGIGSDQWQVMAAYGTTSMVPDGNDVRMDYDSLGLSFYLDADSFYVFEIHLRETTTPTVTTSGTLSRTAPKTSGTRPHNYRLGGI